MLKSLDAVVKKQLQQHTEIAAVDHVVTLIEQSKQHRREYPDNLYQVLKVEVCDIPIKFETNLR